MHCSFVRSFVRSFARSFFLSLIDLSVQNLVPFTYGRRFWVPSVRPSGDGYGWLVGNNNNNNMGRFFIFLILKIKRNSNTY